MRPPERGPTDATRPPYDDVFGEIAEYTLGYEPSEAAFAAAHQVLLDSVACAFLALDDEACTAHLGPLVPGTTVPGGARVIGTPHVLDPVKAAFDTTCLIRWLDYNDTWLALEWGHPSDNLGAALAASQPAIRHLAPVVRASQEFFDGGGYPDGLAGEAIPLAARIIAVADAYHAMRSDRPYRAALGRDAAIAELARCAGTQFDPVVVHALIAVVAERDPQAGSEVASAA